MGTAIAIVGSMERELAPLRRRIRGQTFESPMFQVTGTGKVRAIRGIEALLRLPEAPERIVSVGFAGALNHDLRTGDLVLSPRLYATGEEEAVESDGSLFELARDALEAPGAPRHFVADSLTVGAPVCTVSDKKALSIATPAWIANMEDYWVGQRVTGEGVPFLSVRVVLDTADQEMPAFAAGLGDREPLTQALLAAVNCIARPGNLPRLLKLSKQVRIAQASLERFCLPFVSKMSADRGAAHYAPL